MLFILTLVFFNNCCLMNVSLIQFEIKHFEQVARCLNQWKNTNGFGNNSFITLPVALLLCLLQQMVSLTSAYGQSYFSNCNNRRMTFAHAAILLSFMQRINEYLVALKDLDYSCFLGYINGQLRQKVNDVM